MSTTEPSAGADEVAAAALAGLPGCSAHRLRWLLELGRPHDVWQLVRSGALPDGQELRGRLGTRPGLVRAAWSAAARLVDLARLAESLSAAGVGVVFLGGAGYPAALRSDPEPPAVLFVQGAGAAGTALAMRHRVAIIGTRRSTNYGLEVARELGRDLSNAGVSVISGLALGIDGAAHEGALAANAAPPVAVVGSGLDVVYPRRHRGLWQRVADAGAVVSEAPLGAAAEPWRFPARNRIIAGLSQVVVVVESHTAGGSMHTVQSAIERGIPVMAVPGSIRSPSSAGTNRLLADGAAPVLDAGDVLVALDLASGGRPPGESPSPTPRPEVEGSGEVEGVDASVLAAVDWTPTATEVVLRRTGLGLGAAAAVLTRLEMLGKVRSGPGWWERREGVR